MKSISSVISTTLMLLVTIAIAGTAYMYITGVFTGKTATSFSISYSYGNNIIISNDGTNPITQFTRVTVDDAPVEYTIIPQDDSLVGYWTFDESLGRTTTDSSGKSNHGNYTGETFNDGTIIGATRTDGKYGKGLSFDGSNKYIEVPNSVSLNSYTNQITVVAWIKYTTTSGNQIAVTRDGVTTDNYPSWTLWASENGFAPSFYINTGSGAVSVRYNGGINLNQWTYVAATYDGVNMKLYVNGTQVSLTPTSGNIQQVVTPLRIGAQDVNGRYQFNGAIDEVRIYNRSLSQAEIIADMNSYRPTNRTIAAWSFEESGQYVNDTHIWVKGKYGSSLSFDGVNDYVQTTNTFSVNTSISGYTISAWIYQTSTGGYVWNSIAGIGIDGVTFGMDTGGGNAIGAWACGYQGSKVGVGNFQGSWHHVVAVFSQNTAGWTPARMYFDGNYVGNSVTDRTTPCSGTSTFQIAKSYGGYYTWFNGLIDEVHIYNHSLTDQEIKASYNIGNIIKPGNIGTMKIFNTLSIGTHTVRVCTPSMCRIGYLTIL